MDVPIASRSNGYQNCKTEDVPKITGVIQVCSDISDPHTLSREMKGISTACKRSGTSQGIIITYDQQDKIEEDGVIINLIPLPVFISQDYSTQLLSQAIVP